jgi:hypothetical protein
MCPGHVKFGKFEGLTAKARLWLSLLRLAARAVGGVRGSNWGCCAAS